MKVIEIEGKEYELESSAFSYIKYQSIFKSSMTKDLQFMQVYLAKQHVYEYRTCHDRHLAACSRDFLLCG